MTTVVLAEHNVGNPPVRTRSGGEPSEYYEVVDGAIAEEPPLGAFEVWVASEIIEGLILCNAGRRLGRIYEEMLFILKAEPRLRRRPDIADVSAARWPIDEPAPAEAPWDVVPDLAVEIVSPTDLIDDLMSKVEEYFAAGVQLVGVVHPQHRQLYVDQSPKIVRILDQDDTLDGAEIIPGFAMPLGKIFPTKPTTPNSITA